MPDAIQTITEPFLELAPGVPANPGNLKTLLARVLEGAYCDHHRGGRHWCKVNDEMGIVISKTVPEEEEKPELYVYLEGREMEEYLHLSFIVRARLASKHFPATEDGLLQAIAFLKNSIHKYRTEGTCLYCQPRTKKLKADGMRICEDCILSEAIGF